jgi:hypothetical protein
MWPFRVKNRAAVGGGQPITPTAEHAPGVDLRHQPAAKAVLVEPNGGMRIRAPIADAIDVARRIVDVSSSGVELLQDGLGLRRRPAADAILETDFSFSPLSAVRPDDAAPLEVEAGARFRHVERWRALFAALAGSESDGFGVSVFREFMQVVGDGKLPEPAELAERFREADADRTGRITFRHFFYGARGSRQRELVAIDPEPLAQLHAATQSGDKRLAAEAKHLLYLIALLNSSTLPAMLRALADTHVHAEGGVSVYAAVGSIGRGVARIRNLYDRLERLPEKVQRGLRLNDSMPELAAPRSTRPLRSRFRLARWVAWLPSASDIEQAVIAAQFNGLTYMLHQNYYNLVEAGGPGTPLISRAWVASVGWQSAFTVDLDSLTAWALDLGLDELAAVTMIPSFTTRWMAVAAAVPCVVAFTLLASFRASEAVAWVFGAALMSALAFAGSVALLALDMSRLEINSLGQLTLESLQTFTGLAFGVLGALLAGALGWALLLARARVRELSARVDDFEAGRARPTRRVLGAQGLDALLHPQPHMRRPAIAPPSAPKLARDLLVAVVLFAAGQFTFTQGIFLQRIFQLGTPLSAFLCAMSLAVLGSRGLSLWARGRLWLAEALSLFDELAVPVLISLLSLLYVPVTQLLLGVWRPAVAACAAGTRFPTYAVTVLDSTTVRLRAGEVRCEPCAFADFAAYDVPWALELPSAAACVAAFCGAPTLTRFSPSDVRLSFDAIVLPFLGPATMLMLVALTVGVPLFFRLVVKLHTPNLERIPAAVPAADMAQVLASPELAAAFGSARGYAETCWRYRLACTRNRAASLYSPFRYGARISGGSCRRRRRGPPSAPPAISRGARRPRARAQPCAQPPPPPSARRRPDH